MVYLILSFALPALWIFYFLKKDKHPEPFPWLLFAFILGIVAAFFSFFAEDIFTFLGTDKPAFFLVSALIEEFFKFLFIWLFIFPKRVFDEPVDAMIYMMVSALGFVSIENLIYILSLKEGHFLILFGRFLGANFLHILSSALIGYGYGYLKKTKNHLLFLLSFLAGWILHFIYNFVIISQAIGFILILPVLWSVFLLVLSELDYLVFINERRNP